MKLNIKRRVLLPRGDLALTIKGEPVPIPFGFGGRVSIKRTLGGRSAALNEPGRHGSGRGMRMG